MRESDGYFAFVLRLLPASFRKRHGDELLALLEGMKTDLGASPSRLRLLGFYLAVTWDVLGAGFGSRWAAGAEARGPASVPPHGSWRDVVCADARFALRQYTRRWGTTIAMLGILSVGMAISILLFAFVHSYAVLPPPGIPPADDLVRIRGSQVTSGGLGGRRFDYQELEAYRGLTGHFSAVAGWAVARVVLSAPDDEQRRALSARASFVTDGYLRVLGVQPVVGPGLPEAGSEDPAGSTAAVIGYRIWSELLGRRPDVIGRTLDLNGVSVTVVGVASPLFQGIGFNSAYKLWLPVASRHALLPPSTAEALSFGAVARLRPGVSLEAATSAAEIVVARAAASAERADTEQYRELRAEVVRTLNGDPYFERDVGRLILTLGGLAMLVLLITCTNVSALLMGLAMARRHEIVVRLSLGATRERIVRQLLTESGFLAVAAGGAALGLVWLVLRLVVTYAPVIPFQLGITWPAAAFTIATALAVGVLFGLAPALHATRLAVATALQDSATAIAGTRLRLQRALVVAQIALTQPFIVAVVAAVFIVSASLRPASPSEFEDQLILVQLARVVADPWSVDPSEVERQQEAEIARLRADLESTPGVASVVVEPGPIGELGPYEIHAEDRVEGAEYDAVTFTGWGVSPGHFSTTGVPLLLGREFESTDVDAGHVASANAIVPVVIPGDVARRLWSGANPIGRRLRPVEESTTGSATLVVTGVIPAPERRGVYAGDHQVYMARDTARAPGGLMVRTEADAEPLLPTVRRLALAAAPSSLAVVQTVSTIQDEWRSTYRRATLSLVAAGALTLLLSAIGLYAVVAFAVGQRRGEIAVRMAVGAPARRVAGHILISGIRLGALGLAIGLPISLLGVLVLNSVPDPGIPEVSLTAVAVLASLMAVLTAVAASFIPACRAAAVDPAHVLRTE